MPQMSKSGMIVEFKYNHNGLRVGKVVNGVETKYQLRGSKMVEIC